LRVIKPRLLPFLKRFSIFSGEKTEEGRTLFIFFDFDCFFLGMLLQIIFTPLEVFDEKEF